ncbi:MAG: hypothetical protein JOY71_19375 [Acetobacteraceae bacterium]|nr:hypothetical protein [Acetobacteraceae bacterium]MBV8590930.1 hypothetical protein [Acetobacteraceae bacterium]
MSLDPVSLHLIYRSDLASIRYGVMAGSFAGGGLHGLFDLTISGLAQPNVPDIQCRHPKKC